MKKKAEDLKERLGKTFKEEIGREAQEDPMIINMYKKIDGNNQVTDGNNIVIICCATKDIKGIYT
jgi:hypothetical protein